MIDSGNQTRLWQAHLHLSADLVRDYCYNESLSEDALQEVRLGLWEATFEWREDMQEKFAHDAWLCMRRRLVTYLMQTAVDRPKLSRNETSVIRELRKHLRAGELISCRLLDIISKESGITRMRLNQLISYWYACSTALSASSFELIEEAAVEEDEAHYSEQHYKALEQGLQALSERERYIIIARHLEDPRKTLAELSEILGVGIARIHQIEAAGLSRLRECLVAAV